MKSISEGLYSPTVKVEGAIGLVEIVVLKKGGKLMIQLVNGGGSHADQSVTTSDFLPPVLDIKLSIATDKKPSKLILQPEGRSLAFVYEDGRATLTVDRVDIHSVIEIVE